VLMYQYDTRFPTEYSEYWCYSVLKIEMVNWKVFFTWTNCTTVQYCFRFHSDNERRTNPVVISMQPPKYILHCTSVYKATRHWWARDFSFKPIMGNAGQDVELRLAID
jgi:hypothetical protein